MAQFRVTDAPRLRAVLETFARLDEARWASSSNYNLTNLCREDLSADEKLLVHWLAYITDRQTPFRRIWDVGGYVLSHLVHEYSASARPDASPILEGHLLGEYDRLRLQCPLDRPNKRLERYGIRTGPVQFASRYMPDDLVLIFRTLAILDKMAGRSFARFIGQAIGSQVAFDKAILRLAAALDQLTYSAGGAVKASSVKARLADEAERTSKFQLDSGHDVPRHGRKRLWAALRDYLKSPEFNGIFVEALRGAGVPMPGRWQRSNPELVSALPVLELPGDVWNNAEVFRSGLFSPYIAGERKSWDMPRTVRETYERLASSGELRFYPEQLDVTFDFVPRMCEQQMCRVCPFGGGIGKLCHKRAGTCCSVALSCCGYTVPCRPDGCTLRDDAVHGFCRNALPVV